WGVAGLWYRLRTYSVDWTNVGGVFEQFRFCSWMMVPSWGSLPLESFFLWAGPYLRMETMYNRLFTYDGAIGIISWGLFGFEGNFSDKDGDGEISDDSFWGTALALGPAFRYSFGEGWTWKVTYVPVYRWYSRGEKTEISLPDAHWTHDVATTIEYMYDDGIKGGLWLSYALEMRDREYRWGYNQSEVFSSFDQGVNVRGLLKIPLSFVASFVKIGGGAFWREKTPLLFGVSANVYEESMAREVRGYHEEDVRGKIGVISQLTSGWQVFPWMGLEVGTDGIWYQALDDTWQLRGGAGVGVRFQWNSQQALMIEYNHPFEKTLTGGQIVAGFVWLFSGEGV
ncbi:MAG: hypothetical protein ACK4TN_01215, partial [Brevinematales bacterium]